MARMDCFICIKMKMKMRMKIKMKMKTTLTAYRRLRSKVYLFLCLLCGVSFFLEFDAVDGWKCLYKEFPVDAQRVSESRSVDRYAN